MDKGARGEVLSRAGLHVLSVLGEQPLVRVSLNVGIEDHPLLLVDEVRDEALELGRVLDLVLRLPKDDPERARLPAELGKGMAVLHLERVAIEAMERLPVQPFRHDVGSIERWPCLLISHLEEEQERELLDVVLVRQTIIAKDVAVVPEFLDDRRTVTHFDTFVWSGTALLAR